jgi:hypothetical protein
MESINLKISLFYHESIYKNGWMDARNLSISLVCMNAKNPSIHEQSIHGIETHLMRIYTRMNEWNLSLFLSFPFTSSMMNMQGISLYP